MNKTTQVYIVKALRCKTCFGLCEITDVILSKNGRHSCDNCGADIENWHEVIEKLNEVIEKLNE